MPMPTYQKLDGPEGLIFVTSEPGTVPEEEFNGLVFRNFMDAAIRLTYHQTALDSLSPSWLALYDITSPAVAQSPEYKALVPSASKREKQIMADLGSVNRRVYENIISYIHPNTQLASLPAQYVFVVHMRVTIGAEDDFNRWYNEEHMVLLSKVAGWLCGKRYRLVESVSRGVKIEPAEDEKPYNDYLAIHELESHGFMGLPEFNAAIKTPWRERVMKSVTFSELRLYERYKVLKPLY
ncbi:hypothetical protein C0991_007047 [Blastosporella zonata]|nr:hypothetical protein C0991_007047 [Blastosporella zonata]